MNEVDLNRKFLEAGDPDTLKVIFHRYYSLVRASVEPLMRDNPAVGADEIAQDTFLKALSKREEIQAETLVGWLLTTARNLAIDERRRSSSRMSQMPLDSLDRLPARDSNAQYASMLAATEAEATAAAQYLVAQLLCLLRDKDLYVILHMLRGYKPDKIAEATGDTPGAVQKRWERIRKWLAPIARNLEPLLDCLPEKNDRKIMERYLDNQPLSEISERLRLSPSTIEAVVKRVIKDRKKAAMVNKGE